MNASASNAENVQLIRQEGGGSHSYDRWFDRLNLASRTKIIVAVSGGSDSLALLLLTRDYLKRRHPAIRLQAITIDHALRDGSADEARQVGHIAASLGVEHRTLRWEGTKPTTGIAAAAREARHELLAQAAQEFGSDLVLMGHTLNDQAETVAMRSARGAGRGNAGIAEATLYDWQTWFARPLLGCQRAELRALLTNAGLRWIDDPSNANHLYERVRVRASLEGAGDEIDVLKDGAKQAAADRMNLGADAAELITRHATMPASGLIQLSPDFPGAANREAAAYALRILLASIGGRPQLCDQTRANSLFERLNAGPVRATLSRAVVDARRSGVFLYREKRGLPPLADYALGIWDGRYRLSGIADDDATGVGPAGMFSSANSPENPENVPESLLRAAGLSQPHLWRNGECLGVADGRSGIWCEPVVAPWARFLPLFDLKPAHTVATLFGASLPLASPFCRPQRVNTLTETGGRAWQCH